METMKYVLTSKIKTEKREELLCKNYCVETLRTTFCHGMNEKNDKKNHAPVGKSFPLIDQTDHERIQVVSKNYFFRNNSKNFKGELKNIFLYN